MIGSHIWWISGHLVALLVVAAALALIAVLRVLSLSGKIRSMVSEAREREALEKAREAQRRQRDRMDAVVQVARGVAHDFNNYLTAILGYSELLLESTALSASQREEIVAIRLSAERARDFTRELLAVSRRLPLHLEVLDLNPIVQDAARISRTKIRPDIELNLNLEPTLTSVEADRQQMNRVIMLLIENACSSISGSGKVTIETRPASPEEKAGLADSDLRPGPYVAMVVRDNGLGMDESSLRHVFEPFSRPKQRGRNASLALAATYGIIKQTGGDISVESREGKGTKLTVYLPATPREVEEGESGGGVASATKLQRSE